MIHTLTLNPAIDQILYLKEFKKNITNRLTSTMPSIGGKGTHVSMNLSQMGVKTCAFGTAHGSNGKHIIDMLNTYENITTKFILKDDNESRVNYLVIEDNGDCCILASPGVTLTDADIAESVALLKENLKKGDVLVLAGDASNVPDSFVYNKMLEELKVYDLKVYIDASGKTLGSCLNARPFLIKPNEDELEQLTGMKIMTDDDIVAAVDSLDKYEIPVVAVSMGGRGSMVRTKDGIYRVHPAKINVFNTIGCGDCFLSGLVKCIEEGRDTEYTLRFATAISAACAESNNCVGFDADRAASLMNEIKIDKIR